MTDDNKFSTHNYDFGGDADVALPADAEFDAWLDKHATDVNAPGSAPRAEMWDAISARIPHAGSVDELSARRAKRARFFLPAALAAALILGVGLDRIYSSRQAVDSKRTASSGQQAAGSELTERGTERAAGSSTETLYRMAAQQTLTQAEMLLVAYRASDVAARDPKSVQQLTQWGRQVLSSTRLLIDSPAGDDPRLRPLLQDLEVVLVQIIQLSGAPLDASERALIDGAITKRQLLPRIRSAVPAGAGEAATD